MSISNHNTKTPRAPNIAKCPQLNTYTDLLSSDSKHTTGYNFTPTIVYTSGRYAQYTSD